MMTFIQHWSLCLNCFCPVCDFQSVCSKQAVKLSVHYAVFKCVSDLLDSSIVEKIDLSVRSEQKKAPPKPKPA